ncbi:hypothetical protein [Paludisphaera soli]|uniref:hypothetical protein n=1 Tax=Paludisphaera soli TaxID=2712865 RepID=UPI0013ED1A47|nr:hypothetical protein [Paludisphaera soli]
MVNPDDKSDREHMTGASGMRAEPADEGVVLEAADVVQKENAPPPPPSPSGRDGERPALPPHAPDADFLNEN